MAAWGGNARALVAETSQRAPDAGSLTARDVFLDQLRGLAVVLMIIDHVLAVGTAAVLARGLPVSIVVIDDARFFRLTITRLALPLFMVVSGYLLADRDRPSRRRQGQLLAAAVVAQILFAPLPGLSDVDVLVVVFVVQLAWPVLRASPVVFAALGMVAAVNVATLPFGWTGYSPALVAALMCLGALAARTKDRGAERARRMPLPKWLAAVGRRPLTAYVGHLAVIWVFVQLFHVQ